jgi:hypothetical protein
MKQERLEFVAEHDLDYPEIGHVMSSRSFQGGAGIEMLGDEIQKLWNRSFYFDEAEIIARHLTSAFDEINALIVNSYHLGGARAYFLKEPIDSILKDTCVSPECVAAWQEGWRVSEKAEKFREDYVVNSPLYRGEYQPPGEQK